MKILCFLPICFKPTHKDSSFGNTRIHQYVNGFKTFFEFNKDIFYKYNVDIVVFDNTINSIVDFPSHIKNIIPHNAKILYNVVNTYGSRNKGAGLIETWKYNKEFICQYDWLIHFEPRQILKSNQFIENFLENPRNLFTMNVNTNHFNTGLFCIQVKDLINYINTINLNDMILKHISIEDNLYQFFINNKILFDTLNKMDLIWFPNNHIPLHY